MLYFSGRVFLSIPVTLVVFTAPTAPQDVMVEVITSFVLNVTWRPPLDGGGRPILNYDVTVTGRTMIVPAPTLLLLIRGEDFLMENTTYM